MRRHHDDLRAGLGDAVHLRHGAEDVRLVLDEMGEINLVGAGIAERPGKMRQLTKDIGIRARLAVQSNGAGDLFLLSAANVENEHSLLHHQRRMGRQPERRAVGCKRGAVEGVKLR